ncbi:MAG: sensor histidine kinase [Ruminococcaceae bacterium]|nr:sensor histidine kinase [Oscillospiraceae bacterium]
MGFFRSIKFQVWLRFEIIVACMLVFSYAFLVLFFPAFYEMMKIDEISRSLETIQSDWYDDDVRRTVETVAYDNKMYVEIYSPRYGVSLPFNNMGGAAAIANISKRECCAEVDDAETGIVYKRFRDERENNTVLMVCSYLGDRRYPDAYIFICSYLQPLGTTMAIFHRQFLFVAAVTAVFTMCISLLFAAKISNPIIIMNNAAKQLPQGRFNSRVRKRDFAEIKQLSETLESASKEIAKSDGLRRELMSNISHDLRTPLTMIKAYAEMIRDLSGDNPEKRERHLKVIIDETDRLSSLVNDILDLSKLESGVAEIHKESFNFGERLGGVVSRFDILRDSDGINIELHAGSMIMIEADPIKMEQVVYNLINNAVTYTGDDNTVIVRLYRTVERTVRFEVTDHGDGIAPEHLPHIWDRYYKVSERNKTHKRAKMGSGIGLSIVKNILEQHGFRYGVDSEQGKGSTFWFEAPDPLAPPEQPKTKR